MFAVIRLFSDIPPVDRLPPRERGRRMAAEQRGRGGTGRRRGGGGPGYRGATGLVWHWLVISKCPLMHIPLSFRKMSQHTDIGLT